MESTIISVLIAYQLPAIFLGSFFFAEMVIIAAAFLAGQGVWSLPLVWAAAFAGTLAADTTWFVIGRLLFRHLERWHYIRTRYEKISRVLNHIARRRSLATFIMIKFLYGTRIVMAMHFSASRMPYLFFIVRDAAATAVWLSVIVALGWFAGRGSFDAHDALGGIRLGVVMLVIVLVGYRLVNVWLNKRLLAEDGDD